jgi:hypothetical protein
VLQKKGSSSARPFSKPLTRDPQQNRIKCSNGETLSRPQDKALDGEAP